MPAAILSFIGVFANGIAAVYGLVAGQDISVIGESLLSMLLNTYLTLLIIGGSATISEWKRIYCSSFRKVFFLFTFPLFMMTYLPVSVAALFQKAEWKPIRHSVSKTLADLRDAA